MRDSTSNSKRRTSQRKIAIGGVVLCGVAIMIGLKMAIDAKNRRENYRLSQIHIQQERLRIYKERDFRDAHIKFSKISAKITKRGDGYNIITVSGAVHNIAKRTLEAPIQAEIETVDHRSQRLKLQPDEKSTFRIELLDEGELRTTFPKSVIKVYLDDEYEVL